MQLFSRLRKPNPTKVLDSDPIIGFALHGNGRVDAIKQGSGMYGAGFGSQAFGETAFGVNVALSQSPFGWSAAYSQSVWCYRCIEVRKSAINRMPWHVYNVRSKQIVPKHPLKIAIKRNRQNIFKKTEQSQLLYGETFIEKAVNDFEYVSDLYWLNNNGTSVIIGAGCIVGYAYTAMQGGTPQNFEPSEIAFMKTDNPFNDLRGMSPTEVIMDEIAISKDVARVVRTYYANDTRVGVILIPKVNLNPGDAEVFMETWKMQHQGVNKAGKPVLMPQDMTVERIQEPASLDDMNLRESTRREICAGYGVPLSLAGGWDDAKYQSLPEQRKSFYEETVIPQCDNIAEFINTELMPYFDDSGRTMFKFDYSAILALTEDALQKNEIYSNRLAAGGITRAEYRQALGHPVRPSDEVYYIPVGATIVPADQETLVTPTANEVTTNPQQQQQVAQTPSGGGSPQGDDKMARASYALLQRQAQQNAGKAKDFNPSQPRDEGGQWSETGAGGGSSSSGGRSPQPANRPGAARPERDIEEIRQEIAQRNPRWNQQTVNANADLQQRIEHNNRQRVNRNQQEHELQTPEGFERQTGYKYDDIIGASGLSEIEGAEPRISVTKDANGKVSTINVKSNAKGVDIERSFHFKNGQPDYIHNDHFYMKEKETGKGTGTKIFKSQVDAAEKMGFKDIRTTGGKSQSMNGYYTWPRLGYDGKVRLSGSAIPEQMRKFGKPPRGGYIPKPDEPGGDSLDYNLSDIMKTPEGRDYWKKYGRQMDMAFSLKKNSRSRKVLDAYYKEKFGESSKSLFTFKADGEQGKNDAPELTPEDEAMLDRIWDEIELPPADVGDVEIPNTTKSIHPPQLTEWDELAAWERKAVNSNAVKAAGFVCYILPKDIQSAIRGALHSAGKSATKPVMRAIFAEVRKSLVPPPAQALDYWSDYDKLMADIGSTWLNDYMATAYENILPVVGATHTAVEIDDALSAAHPVFEQALLGTDEQPGALVKLIMAGMAAGQQAINHGSAANPQRPMLGKALVIDWNLLAHEARDFAREYLYSLIRGVDDTTRKLVQDATAKWIESGADLDALKQAMQDIFHNKVRADAIAETESTRAYVSGAVQRYGRSDVKKVKLSRLNDDLVCDICRPLEGTVVLLSEGWTTKAGVPFPPFHTRCRHWIIPADLDED